jgi:voltage-gated potassium channel
MSPPTKSEAVKRLTPLQVVTLILSVYVLVALFIQSAFHLPPGTDVLLDRIDFFVCLIFLADFFTRLIRAPSKLAFLKWGWIDFVSSIPMFDVFRVGRVVRIIRIFRMLRAFRSTKNLLSYLLRDRKSSSLAAVATISFVLTTFAAIAILQFETLPESNIKTPGDAFWWAFVTITTVGYGDKFPISTEGRVIACILMTCGVGLFGTFAGFVASLLVEPTREEQSAHHKLACEIQELRSQIENLETSVKKSYKT